MKALLLFGVVIFQTALLQGCFSDQPVSNTSTDPGQDSTASDDTGHGQADTSSDVDTNLPPDSDSSAEPSTDPIILDTDDYIDWALGNDTWAPGTVTSFLDDTHPGWTNARCFECHGVGKPWEPVNHDPRMQYWSWSCSRGFPGAACHGHGINGATSFNHGGASYFFDCTRAGCHTELNAPSKFTENHGFMNTPDAFCNACHDYFWQDWPASI